MQCINNLYFDKLNLEKKNRNWRGNEINKV